MLQMGDLRFMMKHADSELLALIEETSPPVDLNRVSIFRTAIRRHEKQARDNNNWMDGVLSDRVELKTEDTSFLNLAGRRRAREGGRRDSLLHIHIAVSCDVSLTLWVMLQHFCVCHGGSWSLGDRNSIQPKHFLLDVFFDFHCMLIAMWDTCVILGVGCHVPWRSLGDGKTLQQK